MDSDPATADVQPNNAESTQAGVSQRTPTNCKYDNDKYKLECAECKRLLHYGCTSLSTYQLQLFITKGYRKFAFCKCVEIPSYLHAFKSNEAHLKTVIKKLEGELREQEERFTEVGNPDHDAFTTIEGSMKKHMKQLGKNVMINLLNELQDSKREMEKKLNHVMIQTKRCYAESVQNTSQDKNQTPNGTYINFCAIMEETKNAEIVEEKEKKLCSKSLIIYDFEESFSDNENGAIKNLKKSI